jgi:hypothetical protein
MNRFIKYTLAATVICFVLTLISLKFVDEKDLEGTKITIAKKFGEEANKNLKTVDISHNLDKIQIAAGDVKIKASKGNQLRLKIKGTTDKDKDIDIKQLIHRDGDEVVIKIDDSINFDHFDPSTLKITANHIEVGSHSTEVEIELPAKFLSLELKAISGDWDISDIAPEKISLKSVSGDATLRHVKTKSLAIKSVSGDITLSQTSADQMDMTTVSGDIDFRSQANDKYEILFKTTSGELSGESAFSGNSKRRISIHTVSGDVDFSKEG